MGRTLPSITNAFLHEQQSLARFRRALRRTDQRALDDLFGASRHHLAAAAYASHLLPFEIMLLSMLVEEHKLVLHLQVELERLHLLLGLEGTAPSTVATGDVPSGTLSAVPSGTLSAVPALPPASLDLHEPSPLYDADTVAPDVPSGIPGGIRSAMLSAIPERKRKWWAGG
jgi:hypothetical protein